MIPCSLDEAKPRVRYMSWTFKIFSKLSSDIGSVGIILELPFLSLPKVLH